ncbi:halocyanin domain-containing protein [Halobacteriales archaeon Cl-PHB]
MTDGKADLSRRGFLAAAAGGTGAAAASGTALAQSDNETGGNETAGNGTAGGNETAGNETSGNETGGNETGGGGGGGGTPDFGGYLDDANLYEGSVQDLRGEDPTVSVGAGEGFAFDPPAIHVDNGATVTWEWTGQGGSHNVVHEDGDFESELKQESGATFEHTFEEDGIYTYYCQPHKAMGMKGAVVVGTDYATKGGSGGGGGGGSGIKPLPNSAKTLGVATSFLMLATLGMSYFFIKYGGDYGDFDE